MRIDFAGIVRDAWAIAKGDGDLLLRVAAPFLFLPAFALTLLVPAMPFPDPDIADAQARADAWMTALRGWVDGYGIGFVAAYATVYFGVATIVALYCDPQRPTVGGALARAARLYPRFLLAMTLIAIPAGAGMWLFVIPGLYVVGRTLVIGPVLLAEAPIGAWRGIRRSLALTRGSGVTLLGLAAFAYLAGFLAGQPFLLIDSWLRAQEGGANPIVLALVDAAAAVVAMVAQLMLALFSVAAYRRLAR
ncbi:hypothetical protein GGQ80_002503 [Sphingomonas jinjuensis]|uniref:Glycerophosphoryl diester phosphodiesterase membrane domain-containing protein n=1 Tax=Sphingomonas jinjuensis TaxID=535907 RepID=A0A840FG20_9SPHN|nr:hypothetical protein [Sphingomonas jinjuensis]MBB4154587.1 hypothetical protein [Sphingomonas jinjuensis]